MTDASDLQGFTDTINRLYEKLNSGEMDYFALLGISRNTITRDIENAYQRMICDFSEQRIMAISDPDLRQKAEFVARKIHRARNLLLNFDERAAYEKRGFREQGPQDEPEEDPVETARNLYRKAKTLYTRQDYATALTALERAIHCDPKKADYYYLMGVCQTRIPTLKREAEKNLLKAVEMEPWNAEHYAALGLLFYSERLNSRAESYFRKALDKEPGHTMARKKLEEIVGPEKKPMDQVREGLAKAIPSIFGKKKK
jgi:tetratricopeptide (TPR) repeat protein